MCEREWGAKDHCKVLVKATEGQGCHQSRQGDQGRSRFGGEDWELSSYVIRPSNGGAEWKNVSGDLMMREKLWGSSQGFKCPKTGRDRLEMGVREKRIKD